MNTTVVIVAHDGYAHYLSDALKSVRQQTVSCKCVVVNNGCSKAVTDVVSGFEETFMLSTRGCRLSQAANSGVAVAKTQFVMRLDADDWMDPHIVEEMERVLLESDIYHAVYCDYWASKAASECVFCLDPLMQPRIEHACGVLMRKSVFSGLGGYDTSLDFQEAFDLWQRFRQKGYLEYRIAVPLYFYRRGHESMSCNPKRTEVRQQLEAKHGGA